MNPSLYFPNTPKKQPPIYEYRLSSDKITPVASDAQESYAGEKWVRINNCDKQTLINHVYRVIREEINGDLILAVTKEVDEEQVAKSLNDDDMIACYISASKTIRLHNSFDEQYALVTKAGKSKQKLVGQQWRIMGEENDGKLLRLCVLKSLLTK